MSELVTINIEDGVADVRLNRAEKYNALCKEMFNAIESAGESISDNKEVRAVVLSGNGKGFCAGLDTEMFSPATVLDEELKVVCGSGRLELLEIKPEGGRLMAYGDFANGRRLQSGDNFENG